MSKVEVIARELIGQCNADCEVYKHFWKSVHNGQEGIMVEGKAHTMYEGLLKISSGYEIKLKALSKAQQLVNANMTATEVSALAERGTIGWEVENYFRELV